MTDPRDELDRALAARLGAMAADDDDAAAVLETMRPGLRRARNRHRVVRVSAAVAALAVAVSLVAVLSSGSARHGNVAVNSSPTTVKPSISPNPPPMPPKTHDVTTTTQPNPPATSAPPGHPANSPAHTIPVAPAPSGLGGNGPTAPGPTIPAQPQTLHYSAPGGSLDLTCSSGRLQLVHWGPDPGWTGQVDKNEPQEIEVRFFSSFDDGGSTADVGSDVHTSEDDQSRIDVKVDSSCAQLVVEKQ